MTEQEAKEFVATLSPEQQENILVGIKKAIANYLPKKVTTWEQGRAYCPSCGMRLPRKTSVELNYCGACGQRLDFGKEEKAQ